MLQYQQFRHRLSDQISPTLTGELRLFCSVTAAYSHLPPILDRFRAGYPLAEIKLTTGNAAEALDKIFSNAADLAIASHPETMPASIAFSSLEPIPLVLIIPALPCPVRYQATQHQPDWAQIPFILPEQGPARRSIELWFRQLRISNPYIYATVSGHEAIVSMVALGCGIALIPDVVLKNSPEPVRHRVRILEGIIRVDPFELGVCAQKKRLNEPLIQAFWQPLTDIIFSSFKNTFTAANFDPF